MEQLKNIYFVNPIKRGAYNTAPSMAIEGSVSYNIRAKGFTEDNCRRLKFLEVG